MLPLPPLPFGAQRRRFALALGATLAGWPLAGSAAAAPPRSQESRPMMGTRVGISAQAEDARQLKLATASAFEEMQRLVDLMSHYSKTSQVAAIGLCSGLQPVEVAPELMQVLQMAQGVARRSDGAFDATVGSFGAWHFDPSDPRMPAPGQIAAQLRVVGYRHLVLNNLEKTAYLTQRKMRLDLGGIAKLFILEAGLKTMARHGIENTLINGGGDIVAASDGRARPWRVGIRDPRQPGRLLAALDLRRGFVASSGDYERFFIRDGRRYHHVLDPKTGYPAQGPHGVTLVGDTLDSVNGLGAATMVLGTAAGQAFLHDARAEALIAGRDDSLWITPGLRRRLLPA